MSQFFCFLVITPSAGSRGLAHESRASTRPAARLSQRTSVGPPVAATPGPAHGLRCYLDHAMPGHRVCVLSEGCPAFTGTPDSSWGRLRRDSGTCGAAGQGHCRSAINDRESPWVTLLTRTTGRRDPTPAAAPSTCTAHGLTPEQAAAIIAHCKPASTRRWPVGLSYPRVRRRSLLPPCRLRNSPQPVKPSGQRAAGGPDRRACDKSRVHPQRVSGCR